MRCPDCGHYVYDAGNCGCGISEHALVHERRWVSVVFFDLSRFSEFALENPLEITWRAVRRTLSEAATQVRRYGGHVDKYLGDGLLAVFGAPRSRENDAGAALEAALAMVTGSPLPARAGVASGLVLRAPLGDGQAGSSTVLGPAVNLAQRLSQAAPPGEVWSDAVTLRLVPLCRHHPLELQVFKGQGGPLRPHRYLGLEERIHNLIGREAEILRLHEALEAARHGLGQHLALVGPLGSGKTHLARHFLGHLPAGVRGVLAPRFSREGSLRHSLYLALHKLIEGDVGEWLGRTPLPPSLKQALAYSVGLLPQAPAPKIELERLMIEGWLQLLALLSESQPLVILLEDLHAADPFLIQLLHHRPRGRVLLLSTSRRNLWEAGSVEVLTVAPLDEAGTLACARELRPDLEEAAHQILALKSRGLPLMLQALSRSQGNQDPLADLAAWGSWAYQPRLDSLPRPARSALLCIAVLGEGADLALVRHLLNGEAHLHRLVEEGFLEFQGERLVFAAPYLRETALTLVSPEQAKRWWLEAAEWCQGVGQLEQAALYLSMAGEQAAAFRLWRLVAQERWFRGRRAEALEAYNEALLIVPSPALNRSLRQEVARRLLEAGQALQALSWLETLEDEDSEHLKTQARLQIQAQKITQHDGNILHPGTG
ncbi:MULTISPECIES: adenylate/guanylate cyclase domain-containing protein [unclassified Meiothermus]|uniref:adenylate/guanylate cyclase domain-containing protein n=1 Tax=unclassified Meiothermus TaxID=370471 RepID=UPI001314F86D|nr:MULTISPECIES: adenylate/guanylate cyclase domain-containing protein [unclassified Meiothermus]